ncbi:MAG: hypothetical protein QOF64_187, partial [Candidatus Binatota bacterium]|nr:hypothetical protein [Candidatus Binatota bacterium]
MIQYDTVILGGGAAGLMCAIEAGKRGRRVLVIERSEKIGKKILISGGGRCNFTNLQVTPENFLSGNPHFCKSALARYTERDFIAMVERHGIAYHEKELGQLFCDQSAKLIVKMLVDESRAAGIRIETGCVVSSVAQSANGFALHANRGEIQTASLVVASGGLSVPKMGATGFGYELAKQFGLRITPTRAGLVPFTFDVNDMMRYGGLSGVSLPVQVACQRQAFSNAMLFTHRGISGPAILQISSYWVPGNELMVNFLPLTDSAEWLRTR